MKFVSFNVNGIRAILNKGFPEAFASFDADVVFLEESKYSETDHSSFPFSPEGYQTYWTVSKLRKGYSGVTAFTRIPPLSVHYGLKEGKYDEEGRVITLEFEEFYFVGAYVPNSGEGLKRLDFRLQYEKDLLEYLGELSAKKPIVYTGDLNVAHQEIDIKNPKANRQNAGFSDEERAKMTQLLSSGFADTFRRLHPDLAGVYSWWSYRFHARENNAGWRIDYFIVSERLLPRVLSSEIRTDVFGSDHCPVVLELNA